MLISNTYSFCLNKPKDAKGNYLKLLEKGEYADIKNGITTKGIVSDPLAGSIFYSKFLIMNKDKWITNSYLGYGLFPITMVPLCYQTALNQLFMPKLEAAGLTVYELPPKPLMKKTCNTYMKELWVYRDELENFMGMDKYFLLDVYKKLLEV